MTNTMNDQAESDFALIRDSIKIQALSTIGSPTLVVRTKSLGSYPAAASRFFACEPITILGPEVEGSSGQAYPAGTTLFAYNLGSSIPAQASILIATFVAHRWVFRHDG